MRHQVKTPGAASMIEKQRRADLVGAPSRQSERVADWIGYFSANT